MVKKVSDKDFKKLIKSRKYEDLTAIQTVEKFFLKKRGYIFKVPKPGTPVVLLVSGGIDSTVAWHYLTFVKKLDVYPVYLHRGTKRWKKEKKAVDYFTRFYREIFPRIDSMNQENIQLLYLPKKWSLFLKIWKK